MKLASIRLVIALLFSFTLSVETFAQAVVAVSGGSVDGNNNLLSLTSEGYTYNQSNLILGELTAFEGSSTNNINILVNDGAGAPAPGNPRLVLLGGDYDLDTGIINQESGNSTVTYEFNAPIFNVPGPDIFFFEISQTLAQRDSFNVTINGQVHTITGGASGDYGGLITTTNSSDLYSVDLDNSDLNDLLTNSLSSGPVDISQGVYGVGLELSEFGVAAFASITSIQYGSAGSSTGDPVLIVGVPEPSSYALHGIVSVLGLMVYRKKKQAVM